MLWISLVPWFGLCFAVAGLGARWTTGEITGGYRTLIRPAIAPPNWVFGPVWSLLYTLMAVAAWRVSQTASSPARNCALALFGVQLGLNLLWSLIFFRKHLIGVALGEVILLWMAIGVTTQLLGRIQPAAAWLLASYGAWVTFATALNAAFWRLNK